MSDQQEIIVANRTAASYSPIVARQEIVIRTGTTADLPFIDRMQKAHSSALGFLPTKALEGKVALGQVLVAEAGELPIEDCRLPNGEKTSASPAAFQSAIGNGKSTIPIAYLIAADRYQKRDEIGYVTQMCVAPAYRRSLVAAQLLQAQFDRSAYGCRLYGCWCAQDLTAANAFWEAMGFTAIAFRTGARRGKRNAECQVSNAELGTAGDVSSSIRQSAFGNRQSPAARIHIFWQKRVRAGDTTSPWWYPSTTGGGALREDRLVFPIPPGVSWRDVLPIVLPEREGATPNDGQLTMNEAPAPKPRRRRTKATEPVKFNARHPGGLWFLEDEPAESPATELAKPTKPPKAKAKIDPRLTAMARELRDRWSEQADLILPPAAPHDVRRVIGQATTAAAPQMKALPEVTALPSAA